MKRFTALCLVVFFVLGAAACGSKPLPQKTIDEMNAADMPLELLTEGAVVHSVGNGLLIYSTNKKFDKLKAYYETYLQEHNAQKTEEMNTEELIENGAYQQEYADLKLSAWTYQGEVNDHSIYISLAQQPIDISSYTYVMVMYTVPSEDDHDHDEEGNAIPKSTTTETGEQAAAKEVPGEESSMAETTEVPTGEVAPIQDETTEEPAQEALQEGQPPEETTGAQAE